MSELRFDNQTVVVTGAGGGLGRAYALLFGSRGANVVVNDLGGSFKGEGKSSSAADGVVEEVKKLGGNAVANYDNVVEGEKIIETAIKSFGRIDILINNAGILRDISFKNMKDQDWDLIFSVHVTGAYKCARAAWPHFRKQKYGRVINTASAAGLFGSFGQCNYSAAKLAMVGFTETLAKEGGKYNILCNVIAPIAASRMTATVMPPDVLEQLKPEFITPLVAVLTHSSNTQESGSIFEIGGGHVAKLRWERAKGLLCKPDDSFTPGTILKGWESVKDYSEPTYATGVADFAGMLETAMEMKGNDPANPPDFKGKVALITGGGAGLGRGYALLFAKYGAKVVINDLMNPDDVVNEIRKAGGEAVGAKFGVDQGEAVVDVAIKNYGRIDILVNNAGILKDKAFTNMSDDLWNPVMDVHARGTYKVTKAAWPYFQKQKYGRIVNTTSTSGIYGNFGQANYSAAKCAILGFSRALALEGQKNNIYVNTIAPNAGTQMTRTIMPEEMVQAFKPHYVAPLVALLCSDETPDPTGGLYEVGCGWQAQTRWQRNAGAAFPVDVELKPEHIAEKWNQIVSFEGKTDNPFSGQQGLESIMANSQNKAGGSSDSDDGDYNAVIAKAKQAKAPGTEFPYSFRDVILYNIGLGCKRTDLNFTYEGADDFQVLPTYGVIPPFSATPSFDISTVVPNFNPMLLLHGEQYLEIRKWPIPTEATLITYPELIDVVDKGKAGVVYTGTTIKDKATGEDVYYCESTAFLRGSGGFNGPRQTADRGKATKSYTPPKRAPDATVTESTTDDQAAIYRLSGDYNPLHIDPDFASTAGFKVPILHGLGFFGIACKHVLQRYGRYRDVKVRFAGTVDPGQTLRTEMWREGEMVVFQTTVVETGKLCIAGAGATLWGKEKAKL